MNQSQFIGHKVQTQALKVEKEILPILEGINYRTRRFDNISRGIFNKNLHIRKIAFFEAETNKVYALLKKDSSLVNLKDVLEQYPLQDKISVLDGGTAIFKKTIEINQQKLIVLVEFANDFYKFAGEEVSDLYSYKIISTQDQSSLDSNEILKEFVKNRKMKLKSSGSILQYNQQEYLVSYSKVSDSNLIAFAITQTEDVLRAFKDLIVRSLMFLVALISASFILAYFISRRMTNGIARLGEITQKIAEGDFELKEKFPYRDELNILFERFKVMAKEIKKLLEQTKEKARMENELENAKIYQSILIPESHYEDNNVKIEGFYNPASECSGDWWFYKNVGDYLYAGIGDVTGHGVSSALLTSAAKAVLENLMDRGVSLAELVERMNHALYQTTQGKLHMTFFVYRFNIKTKVLEYCNASHDPAVIYRKDDQGMDCIFLDENSCERLASVPKVTPAVSKAQLKPDDVIFLWTDGITELTNPRGRALGEKKLHKFVIEELENLKDFSGVVDNLYQKVDEFSNHKPLDDDITYFFSQVK